MDQFTHPYKRNRYDCDADDPAVDEKVPTSFESLVRPQLTVDTR